MNMNGNKNIFIVVIIKFSPDAMIGLNVNNSRSRTKNPLRRDTPVPYRKKLQSRNFSISLFIFFLIPIILINSFSLSLFMLS